MMRKTRAALLGRAGFEVIKSRWDGLAGASWLISGERGGLRPDVARAGMGPRGGRRGGKRHSSPSPLRRLSRNDMFYARFLLRLWFTSLATIDRAVAGVRPLHPGAPTASHGSVSARLHCGRTCLAGTGRHAEAESRTVRDCGAPSEARTSASRQPRKPGRPTRPPLPSSPLFPSRPPSLLPLSDEAEGQLPNGGRLSHEESPETTRPGDRLHRTRRTVKSEAQCAYSNG